MKGVNSPLQNHIVITGTGRAGTTFLISLCTRLGLDTGFDYKEAQKMVESRKCKAGLEHDLGSWQSGIRIPYIFKDPDFLFYMDQLIDSDRINIEHVFVPMRNLSDAAESRRTQGVGQKGGLSKNFGPPELLEENLQKRLCNLFLKLSATEIGVTLLNYPQFINEPKYLYNKLQPILKEIEYGNFLEAFNDVVEPSWVNEYRGVK